MHLRVIFCSHYTLTKFHNFPSCGNMISHTKAKVESESLHAIKSSKKNQKVTLCTLSTFACAVFMSNLHMYRNCVAGMRHVAHTNESCTES